MKFLVYAYKGEVCPIDTFRRDDFMTVTANNREEAALVALSPNLMPSSIEDISVMVADESGPTWPTGVPRSVHKYRISLDVDLPGCKKVQYH